MVPWAQVSQLFPLPQSFPRSFTSPLTDCLHGLSPSPFLLSYSVFVFSFLIFRIWCRALDLAGPRLLLSARK